MAILSISTDWGSEPRMVRITTDDSLATITTSGYLTGAVVAASIDFLNHGAFEWVEGDLFAINFSDGEGFFTRDATTNAFVAEASPGALSETLAVNQVFVGSAGNIATAVAMSGDIGILASGATAIQAGVIVNADINAAAAIAFSKLATLASGNMLVGSAGGVATSVAVTGDVTISNAGVTTIASGAVDLAMLSAGIAPAYIVKFAGKESNGGGSATIAITQAGVLTSDIVFAQVQASTNAVTVNKVTPTADTVTVLLSGDPGAATVVSWQVLRAAA